MPILTVGAGQAYSTIAAAVAASQDGDTVQVQAGTYVNDFATISTRILIQGVGGMVNLVATVPPPNGKAYFTTNTDVTVDHLAFSGVQVADQNGAGIRYQGGNLTVTNCYFHDNQEGILGTPDVAGTGTITIKNSEFAHNGAGDGYSHNIYIGDVASLNIDNSYFHDAVVGHEIKSRAEATTITNSRIQNGPNGTASYVIDLPNGGAAVIKNNVIEKGPNAENPAIIAYGEEGNLRLNSTLTVTGNTILNDLNSSSAVAVWNAAGAAATVTGNAIYGLPAGQVIRGAASAPGNTMLSSEPALVTTSPWAGAAATVPTLPAAPVLPAAGPLDTLVLNLSEDAYLGDALFTVSVDGVALGGAQAVTALHGQGQTEAFTLTGNFGAGPHQVGVSFTNDLYAPGLGDRNLFVNGISLDGTANPSATAPMFSGGTHMFTVSAAAVPTPTPTPAPVPTPTPTDTLVLSLSEDAYLGDAQFTATVDGRSLGAAQSVTASHGQGQTQVFAFTGSFGAGPHQVGVSFLNDLYAPGVGDRNLFVNGITLDGTANPSATAPLYSQGTQTFTVSGASAPPVTPTPTPVPTPTPTPTTPITPDTLVLNLSEDMWQGDAQFTAAVDGKSLGAAQSVTAIHGAGHTEAFTFAGNFGAGAHDLAISFVNDAWGGTSATDRNLFVNSASLDGTTYASATTPLFSNGTVHFQIGVPSAH